MHMVEPDEGEELTSALVLSLLQHKMKGMYVAGVDTVVTRHGMDVTVRLQRLAVVR